MTTDAFAQDWGVDSRTRIDMSGDNDKMSTAQRATVSATWGGSDWGVHASSDINYTLGTEAVSYGIYEAHASADLMGYASLSVGRMAINNGSGALMSTNDWGTDRTTWDGMKFGLNLDMADITIGYHSVNAGGATDENNGNMWINAGGEFSGWNVNFLYMTNEVEGETGDAATGIDISGEVAGAGISASMNTDFEGDEMRVIGLTYAINDDMGVHASQTVYGEDGDFRMIGTNMDGSWDKTGSLGYQSAGGEVLAYGLTYNLSGISLGATMYNLTNSMDEAIDTDATEISLGYSLNDNAALSLSMVDDNDVKYMWLTINVGL
jgi:hypothetical protein